jgi:hypothetical protein
MVQLEGAGAVAVAGQVPSADVQAVLVAQQLVQREPQGVDQPRQHRQRRHVGALLDRGQVGTRTAPPPRPRRPACGRAPGAGPGAERRGGCRRRRRPRCRPARSAAL